MVQAPVKRAINDAAGPVAGAEAAPATKVNQQAGLGTRLRQWLMTGVGYMIVFVAAGGILIASSHAPHGGIWVIGQIGRPLLYLVALVAGALVTAACVVLASPSGAGRPPRPPRPRRRRRPRWQRSDRNDPSWR